MEESDSQHAMKMISMVTPKTSKDLQLQNALSFDVLPQGCMFFPFVLSERKLSMSSAQFGAPCRIFCILQTPQELGTCMGMSMSMDLACCNVKALFRSCPGLGNEWLCVAVQ